MHTSFVVKTSKFGSEVVVFVGIFHEEVANKQVKAFCFSQMKKNTNLFYAANQKKLMTLDNHSFITINCPAYL